MNFTAQERKLVERLRKQERQWRITRWVLLVGGVAVAVMWSWVLWRVFKIVESERDGSAELLLALAYPKALFGLMAGAIMVGFALRDWWGHPTRLLLLKVIEELESPEGSRGQSAPQDAPPNGGPATQSGSPVGSGPSATHV